MDEGESIWDKGTWKTAEELGNEYVSELRLSKMAARVKTIDLTYGKPRPRDFWDHLAVPDYDPWDKYMPPIPLATPVQLELGW